MSKRAREFKAAVARAGRATSLVSPTFAAKYSEDEARDEHGRWTSDGGGGPLEGASPTSLPAASTGKTPKGARAMDETERESANGLLRAAGAKEVGADAKVYVKASPSMGEARLSVYHGDGTKALSMLADFSGHGDLDVTVPGGDSEAAYQHATMNMGVYGSGDLMDLMYGAMSPER